MSFLLWNRIVLSSASAKGSPLDSNMRRSILVLSSSRSIDVRRAFIRMIRSRDFLNIARQHESARPWRIIGIGRCD
jgi:hypothetical protein